MWVLLRPHDRKALINLIIAPSNIQCYNLAGVLTDAITNSIQVTATATDIFIIISQ